MTAITGVQMTLSIPRPHESHSRRRSGFTLVEMLVVIGVIVMLVGILLPAVNKAYTYAVRSHMQQNIQSIKSALESYKTDHSNYPLIDYTDTQLATANYAGAVVLCWALVAPGNTAQDGSGNYSSGTDLPAPGFSIVPKGQVYGPYLMVDNFKLMTDAGMTTNVPGPYPPTSPPNEPNWYLSDRYGHPILYFKANKSADIYNTNYPGFVADWTPSNSANPAPLYNLHDNEGSATYPALWWAGEASNANALIRMRLMLGDLNANGMIDKTTAGAQEVPTTTEPYLIWSAGPNEIFGVDVSSGNLPLEASYVPSCDDATSFTP